MSIKVANDTNNGSAIIKAPNSAGDFNIITPAFSTELAPRMQLMTAQNSTSGTSIDFTGIPSWAKKITVMFSGVSTSGTSPVQVQLGTSGGFTVLGYAGQGDTFNTSSTASSVFTVSANSTGFKLEGASFNSAANIRYGSATLLNITTNTWGVQSYMSLSTIGTTCAGTGSVTLSGILDRIRVTTVNGTDTFDAGQINVLYEG